MNFDTEINYTVKKIDDYQYEYSYHIQLYKVDIFNLKMDTKLFDGFNSFFNHCISLIEKHEESKLTSYDRINLYNLSADL